MSVTRQEIYFSHQKSKAILLQHAVMTVLMNQDIKISHMRTRFREFFPAFVFLLASPVAFWVLPQLGVDMPPIRSVKDRYPVFTDVAVDPNSNILAVSDENLFSLRTYDRDLNSDDVADPRTVITGNKTGVDFVCGVAIDPTN